MEPMSKVIDKTLRVMFELRNVTEDPANPANSKGNPSLLLQSPSRKGKETGSDSEPRYFDVERSNPSVSRSTGLAITPGAATPFEGPEACSWDHEELGSETGTPGVFPRLSRFLSTLLNPGGSFLAGLSVLG